MTLEQIKNIACKRFNITKEQLVNGGRKIEVVYAKIAISQILHKKGYSDAEISDSIGMHRTTIIHYLATFKDRLKFDETFKSKFEEFEKDLQQ